MISQEVIILEGLNNLISNERCLKILEYDAVIEKWCQFADTRAGKERIRAITPMAKDLLLSQELDIVEESLKVLEFYPDYHFGGIYSIKDSIKRAKIGSILSSEDFVKILLTVQATQKHQKFFATLELAIPHLKELSANLVTIPQIEKEFERMLNEHGELLDDASPELARIRRESRVLQLGIRNKLDNILKATENQKFFQEALYSVRGNRYVIPVKQEYRHQFPGIIHDQSSSGQTVFIEPMALVEINNELSQLNSAERNEIERLFMLLTRLVASNSSFLSTNSEFLTELDFIFSKGKFSRSYQGIRPKVCTDTRVKLIKARHPLLNPQQVVPISIVSSNNCSALVITGPNTGGKTVALKTIGLLAAMHQSGLLIPADYGSEIPIFQGIFADIGDEQSLEQNLSTFSGHMTQIIEILSNLTNESNLILLDELGAGTDPEEGTALAMAILEKLIEKNAKIFLTSHYGELKAHAFSHPKMENASMEFDSHSLRPTYRLILGMPGESNALAISKRLGLADDIIQLASQKVRLETKELNELLTSLRGQRDEVQRELEATRQERVGAERERRAFEIYKEKWLDKQNKNLEKIKFENQKFLSESRKEVSDILSSLKEYRQNNLSGANLERHIQKERDRLSQLEKNLPQFLNPDESDTTSDAEGIFMPGDGVYLPTLKTSGIIISVEDNQLWVEVGAMKLKAPKKGARKLAEPPKPEAKKDSGRRRISRLNEKKEKQNMIKSIGIEIDVRGESSDEAILRIERFIDESLVAGSSFIRIIHGKGTGILKAKVHEMLREHPNIKDYNFAPFNQGGDGATEVKL
jgi:MutS2 family protein